MVTQLDVELRTYEQQKSHLLTSAEGKFVLIHADQVVGVYDSQNDAIVQGYERFGNVPFLVKQVLRVESPQNFISSLLAV